MTTSHPAAQVLQALFQEAPHHLYLEVRPISPEGGVVAGTWAFFPLRQLQRYGFDQALPTHLDGKANVYFGVCPRVRQGGTAADVALATCLWVDEVRKPWPEGLPRPTAMLETSPEKYQGFWVLDQPTRDLDRVERLNRRLVAALGGDNVGDRARVMRLPGFRNVKPEHPDHPVAHLQEFHPGRRFTLEELEAALPPLYEGRKGPQTGAMIGSNTPFDAHAGGGDAPQAVLDEVATELRAMGAGLYHDGRLLLPCPFPHREGPCGCPQAFYYSPFSGRWWCFCTDHPGRKPDKVCVTGTLWRLWAALFPGRPHPPQSESSPFSPSTLLGENANSSPVHPYSRPVPAHLEALKDAPARKRTAELLRLVGAMQKAFKEQTCGAPLKGRCTAKKEHGVVREGRASGKTPWCAGCHTETSARYLHVTFPQGPYSILRLQKRLYPLHGDTAEVQPGVWEMDPDDSDLIAGAIQNEYVAAKRHFRRVQRRYGDELLGWHFAVDEDQTSLWVELQVLVHHSGRLHQALRELTGDTRKRALFVPDAVVRYDYRQEEGEQLRREWAGLLKCTLLRLETNYLFRSIYEALNGLHLSQAYGDLRTAYEAVDEGPSNGEAEDVTRCPVVVEDGHICGAKLAFFLDPEDRHPVNPLAYTSARRTAAVGREPPGSG